MFFDTESEDNTTYIVEMNVKTELKLSMRTKIACCGVLT